MKHTVRYLTLIILFTHSLLFSQTKSLYDFGQEIFEILKSDKTEDILKYSKEKDIDKNATVLESFLNIKDVLQNIAPLDQFKYFNTVEGTNDKMYIILKKEKKYYIIRTTLDNDNSIAGPFQLMQENYDKQLALGEKVYKSKCFACHGIEARGSLGPNLTDMYWKYVNSDEDLYDVIANGKKGTMMTAYKNYLSSEELQALVTYMKVLIGKKSQFGKKPGGEKKEIHFKIF